MARYHTEEGNFDVTVVVDSLTAREVAVCSTYDDTTDDDHRVRARAIADALNASGFDYQPEVEV